MGTTDPRYRLHNKHPSPALDHPESQGEPQRQNRRQTIRVGAGVAFAQVGIAGFDGQIELEALRLFGLPEAAPAVLNEMPLLTGALFG